LLKCGRGIFSQQSDNIPIAIEKTRISNEALGSTAPGLPFTYNGLPSTDGQPFPQNEAYSGNIYDSRRGGIGPLEYRVVSGPEARIGRIASLASVGSC
jgi:hypothetical protein